MIYLLFEDSEGDSVDCFKILKRFLKELLSPIFIHY